MVRANIDITIVEGGTFDKNFQWKTGTPPVAVDLTGYSARMQVRAKLKDTETLLDIETVVDPWAADGDSGIYFAEDVEDEGKWKVYIRDDDTQGICAAHKDISGVYDLFLYSAGEEAVLQLYGVATLVAAVTRDE